MTFHCLFEQSGTFKNVFREFGHDALDYDILNDYGQTDKQIDLFNEIELAYNVVQGKAINSRFRGITIFEKMRPGRDFIIAFFPCTYFTHQQEINFKLQTNGTKKVDGKFSLEQIERVINMTTERARYFQIFLKFCFVCEHLRIPMILENPAGNGQSYLEKYSPYRPSYHEKNRALFGDNYEKPTNYYAINFHMKETFCGLFYDIVVKTKKINKTWSQKARSEITPTYARNFYKRFIEQEIKKAGVA